ncbi:MAG: hypothetical protein H6838_12230 [Planctomycetes bacterium]|nr:hypothetical protein [Planctomycetota bacterium]
MCLGLAAQNKPGTGGPGERPAQVGKQREIEAEAGDDGSAKSADGKAQEEAWESLTPEQRLERSIRSGASAYCRFVAAVRPSRLLPGQSGTLYVTAVLQGAAVLPAPAPLQVTSPATQGSITLGAPTFHPAKPGTLASGYLGRPVYDNTAIFEIPVTMAADAKIGTKQPVHVDMKFDLYDGTSAQVVGRFVDRATTEVEVGLAADPSVTMPVQVAAGARTTNPTGTSGGSDTNGEAGAMERAPALGGEAVTPGAAASHPVVAAEEPLDPQPIPDAGGNHMQFLLVGGGVLVLLILGLLIRRK